MKRIAHFIPFMGCKRRCVYCDQTAITGAGSDESPLAPNPAEIAAMLARETGPVELCFFGGSFARLEPSEMRDYLNTVSSAPDGSRVTFSSYPADFADRSGAERLALIRRYPIGTVELGVPSLDRDVLKNCGRDDPPEMTTEAICRLRDAGIHIGLQIMIGLPGQTPESSVRDLRYLASLMAGSGPWDLRIYPCLVLRGTRLADMYRDGTYAPLSLEDAVRQSGHLLVMSQKLNFTAIRVGLLESAQLKTSIIAGPYHPAFGELALSEKLAIELASAAPCGPWHIAPHQRSQLTGHGARGINRLAEITGLAPKEIRKKLNLSSKPIHLQKIQNALTKRHLND